MNELGFETALNGRVADMLDACTRCGKCVEACPSVTPANIAKEAPQAVVTGVIKLLRTGDGPDASRRWAASCMLSGACIEACHYGVNPRFLLAMARSAARPSCKRDSVATSRLVSRNLVTPSWRRSARSRSFRRTALRAIASRKRGLTP